MLSQFKTHIKLFFQTPKDFVWTLLFSGKENVEINPFNRKSSLIARKFMKKLTKNYSGLSVYLIGSVGLGIEGRGDIDLIAGVAGSEYEKAFAHLSRLLGEPSKVRKTFSEWEIISDGCPIELALRKNNDRYLQNQLILFNLLKNNPLYLKEYRRLKNSLNSNSLLEYKMKRMEFFNYILSENSGHIRLSPHRV